MSAAVLHKIGEITGGVSVGRARHPKDFLVKDKKGRFDGKCSPLPVVAIASSARDYSMCKVLPESLPQILNEPNNSKKNATTSKLKSRVSICEAQKSVQGALQVFNRGANLLGAAKKFTAVVLTNACRYDYEFKDKYVRLGVHKAGFKIIDKALENLGHRSDRILIGVARFLITADMDFYSSDKRELIAAINVTEAGRVNLSGKSSEVEIDYGGHGVIAVGYTAFIFERVRPRDGESSPWNISKPFHVNSWDDELFHKALSYCAKRSRFVPRGLKNPVKKEFVLDRVVEGPTRGRTMEQDLEDRKSETSSARKSSGAQPTLTTLNTSPRLRVHVPPVLIGAESVPGRPQGPLVRHTTPRHLVIPVEVEPPSDDDTVMSELSFSCDIGNIKSEETPYFDALMGGPNEIVVSVSSCSDASDAAVADSESILA